MRLNALRNEYQQAINRELYDKCPKAVFAAIAVSALSGGSTDFDHATDWLLKEWWTLHHNGIVSQRPPAPEP